MLRVEESKKTHDDSSSSSSSDSEEDHVERIQYITSFGGTGSDGEGAGVIQGPAPPPSDTKKRLQSVIFLIFIFSLLLESQKTSCHVDFS